VNISENNKKVNEYIGQSDKLNRSKDLIIDDINKQENNFRLRLEERKKNKLSSSFIQEEKNRSFLNDNKSQNNIDIPDNDMIINQIIIMKMRSF